MNTDLAYIVTDQSEATPRLFNIANFARSHRAISAVLGIAVASGIALTSSYAIKGHAEKSTPHPKKELVFQLDEKRTWLSDKSAPAKHSAMSSGAGGIQRASFHLTFDDGPHPQYTPEILDWLKEQHLHATFFLVGQNVVRYPELVKRIVAEGHQIGNHSWSHPKLTIMGDTAVRSQIKRTHEAIVKACGVAPKLFRPPYGALSDRQRAWIEPEFHYKTMLWDIDTLDWTKTTSAAVASRIEHGLKPGSPNIILSHDIHPRILPALQSLLPKLQAHGFTPAKSSSSGGLIAKAP